MDDTEPNASRGGLAGSSSTSAIEDEISQGASFGNWRRVFSIRLIQFVPSLCGFTTRAEVLLGAPRYGQQTLPQVWRPQQALPCLWRRRNQTGWQPHPR